MIFSNPPDHFVGRFRGVKRFSKLCVTVALLKRRSGFWRRCFIVKPTSEAQCKRGSQIGKCQVSNLPISEFRRCEKDDVWSWQRGTIVPLGAKATSCQQKRWPRLASPIRKRRNQQLPL